MAADDGRASGHPSRRPPALHAAGLLRMRSREFGPIDFMETIHSYGQFVPKPGLPERICGSPRKGRGEDKEATPPRGGSSFSIGVGIGVIAVTVAVAGR
jgi:hypothetical protein